MGLVAVPHCAECFLTACPGCGPLGAAGPRAYDAADLLYWQRPTAVDAAVLEKVTRGELAVLPAAFLRAFLRDLPLASRRRVNAMRRNTRQRLRMAAARGEQ